MLTALQKAATKFIIAFIMIIVLFGCGSQEPQSVRLTDDIVPNMRDGLENHVIREIYAQDIYDVETITNSKRITLEYYEFDLNSDEIVDMIVAVKSPLHGGMHGTHLDFLIGNGDGTFRQISNLNVHLYGAGEGFHSSMYILESKTNGFHDILIIYPDGESKILTVK